MKFLTLGLFVLSATILSEAFRLPTNDDKDQLKKDLEELKAEAKKVLDELAREGKQALGKDLEKLEKVVEDIERQLEKLEPKTDIGKKLLAALEGLAKQVEQQLRDEIKRLEHRFNDFDVKDDLKKVLDDLKAEALKEIQKLEKAGKKDLAKDLVLLEKEVELIEDKLQHIDPKTVGKQLLADLAVLVKKLEQEVKDEIKRLDGKPPVFDTKDDLKKLLDDIKAEALKEIQKLEKAGKKDLAKELQLLEQEVEKLEDKIRNIDPKTDIGKQLLTQLVGLVKKLEQDVKDEIKRLEGLPPVSFDEKNDLKKELDQLIADAKKVLADLEKQGKGYLGKQLLKAEQKLEQIESQLEKLSPKTDVGKFLLKVLEDLALEAEDVFKQEIQNLKH